MPNLSYSFHLGRINKKTGQGHSLKTTGDIVDASKHNLRQFTYPKKNYDRKLIDIMQGSSSSILDDVKRIYHEEFDDALAQYNAGKRADRRIDDYLSHVSDSRSDAACEIIIQIGDREFWDKKRSEGWSRQEIRNSMRPIFREQIREFQKLVPEFQIASAIAHYDESSPHIHIVGIPVASGYKKGMAKQVAKTKVFTADRLSQLQDDMRFNAHLMIDIYAENEKMPFGNPYDGEYWNIDPDAKQAGRNKDIPVYLLDEFYRTKRESENLKADIQEQQKEVQKLEEEKANTENALLRKKTNEQWIDRSIALKKLEKDSLSEQIDTLKDSKSLLSSSLGRIRAERDSVQDSLNKAKSDAKALLIAQQTAQDAVQDAEREKSSLDAEIARLRADKRTLSDSITALERTQQTAQEAVQDAEREKSSLDAEIARLRADNDALTAQIEDKLSIVDSEMSPDQLIQMLNDSLVANLAKDVSRETCRQLSEQGLLKVSQDSAFIKISHRSILDKVKDNAIDFIDRVKSHMRSLLGQKSKKRRKSR